MRAPANGTIDSAVSSAISQGIPVIAGAGNDGQNASNYSPGRVSSAITVGASEMSNINYGAANVTESRRFDSNFGSVLDLFAPGSSFVGAAQTGYNFGGSDSVYDGLSGTSAAAPHVAGIAAMYLEAHPGALPSEVQQAIVDNATTGVLLDPGPGSPNRLAYTNFLSPPDATVQFSSANYVVTEGTPSVTLTVNRTGSTANAASVKFFTDYNPGVQCNDSSGQATQRCDFTSAFGTIRFLPGESSKTFTVLITDDGFVEPTETMTIQLGMPSGVDLGSQLHTQVTITDNDSSAGNPIDTTPFFIRQHYADFLNREPEPPGLAAWISILDGCPPSGVDANGNFCDRIEVSSDFYRSTEFQVQGSVVYRYYAAALGRIPGYTEFFTDMARISGFQSDAEREANKIKLFEDYAQRPEFAANYNALDSTGYVDQLAAMVDVTLTNRDQLINGLNSGQKNRAQVLRDVVEFNSAVQAKYFNEAFVIMEYFGYLRRDADISYLDWLNTLNSTGSYRVMINGFMNSAEYRGRFGQ